MLVEPVIYKFISGLFEFRASDISFIDVKDNYLDVLFEIRLGLCERCEISENIHDNALMVIFDGE